MSGIYEALPMLSGINTIMEIGCHQMTDTRCMRALFPAAVIHCVEPDPRNIKFVETTNIASKLRVTFHPVALSDKEGKAPFYLSLATEVNPEWTASSSLRRPCGFEPWFLSTPVEVTCKLLDSLSIEHGLSAIDLIWMDAQGCENLIITGGQKTLQNTRYLFTEHNTNGVYEGATDYQGILKLLPGEWKIMEIWPYDMLLENKSQKKL